jgi:hypothetical protein
MWKSFFKQHNLIQDQYSPQQKSTTNPVPNKKVQVKKYNIYEDEDDIFSPNNKFRKPEQKPVQKPKPKPEPDQEFDFDPNVPLPPDRFDPDWLVVKERVKNMNR